MKLYLVRHAIAEPPSAEKPDAERALTDEGRTSMREVARGLRAIRVDVDVVLTSPFRRARETADLLAAAVDGSEVRVLDVLASGASPPEVLAAVRPHRNVASVALVGHEPDLGRLASFLLTGSEATPLAFQTASVACFECTLVPGMHRADLEWFLTPAQLRRLGSA